MGEQRGELIGVRGVGHGDQEPIGIVDLDAVIALLQYDGERAVGRAGFVDDLAGEDGVGQRLRIGERHEGEPRGVAGAGGVLDCASDGGSVGGG